MLYKTTGRLILEKKKHEAPDSETSAKKWKLDMTLESALIHMVIIEGVFLRNNDISSFIFILAVSHVPREDFRKIFKNANTFWIVHLFFTFLPLAFLSNKFQIIFIFKNYTSSTECVSGIIDYAFYIYTFLHRLQESIKKNFKGKNFWQYIYSYAYSLNRQISSATFKLIIKI